MIIEHSGPLNKVNLAPEPIFCKVEVKTRKKNKCRLIRSIFRPKLMPPKCHQRFLAFEKQTCRREQPASFLGPTERREEANNFLLNSLTFDLAPPPYNASSLYTSHSASTRRQATATRRQKHERDRSPLISVSGSLNNFEISLVSIATMQSIR